MSIRIAANRNRTDRYSHALASWPGVLICILLIRLLLNLPVLVGARLPFLQEPFGYTTWNQLDPLTWPGVWSRWDSAYYLSIAAHGYSYHGPDVNFWPVYPLALRVASLGFAPALPWAGAIVSFLSFVAVSVLLWKQTASDFGQSIAWATVITLSLFPTSFFFSAVYTESLFLLLSVLVYWFAARKRYYLAALFVALASVTRVYGILLLVLLLAEMAGDRSRRGLLRMLFATGLASSLLVVYLGFVWITQGSPLAILAAEQGTMQRAVTLPGLPLAHGLAVALWGYGGFRDNWYMRVVSAHDSLVTILFLASTVAGFFVLRRKSLALYTAVAMLALMVSHGPYALGVYSMSRYVLVLFPAFIVIAMTLTRFPRLKWIIWTGMAALLCLLTAWFAAGRWIA